jgi:hypothetical protein
MCHTQFKNQKIIWTLSPILVKHRQLISVKTHPMKKIQTHRYNLKYKKTKYANLSVMVFFLLKINRLFLIRDVNFKMNQKNNPSNPRFFTSLICRRN